MLGRSHDARGADHGRELPQHHQGSDRSSRAMRPHGAFWVRKTSFIDAVAMATVVAGMKPCLRPKQYDEQASKARNSSVSVAVGADKWSISKRDGYRSWESESIHVKGRSFAYQHESNDEKRKEQEINEHPALRDFLKGARRGRAEAQSRPMEIGSRSGRCCFR